jgi:predicted RNA-binding protein YlqC (UPF0109 family)
VEHNGRQNIWTQDKQRFAFIRVHLTRRSYCAKADSLLVFWRMREFLEFVIRQLIEFPDDMVLTEIPSGRTTVFKLQLRRGDVGRVIGRGGQTIQAIRALLASSAARHGQRAILEIVE